MSSTLASQVEEFVNGAGKVNRTVVYAQFELVGKRYIDRALTELAERARLVVGAAEVAPVRAAPRAAQLAVFGESATHEYAMTESAVERDRRRQPRATQTLPERLLDAMQHGETMTVRDIVAAVQDSGPRVSEADVRKTLSKMKGREVDNPSWGRWALSSAAVNRRGVSLPRRLMALFSPGARLTRAEIRALLPDANDGSVSAALADLVAAGNLRNERCRGYWLPGTVHEVTSK